MLKLFLLHFPALAKKLNYKLKRNDPVEWNFIYNVDEILNEKNS